MIAILVVLIILAGSQGQGGNNSASSSEPSVANAKPSICDISPQTLQQQAQQVDYKQLNKDPGSFAGKMATFTGKILQIQQSGNEGVIRLSVTKDSLGYNLNDFIYITYHQPTQAVEDDIVTVTGKLTGSETYTSQANYQITVPSMDICSVQTKSEKSVASNSANVSNSTKQTSSQSTTPKASPVPAQKINCYTDNQCGTNSFSGGQFCQGNAIYQSYITYICNNPGTPQSYCSNETTQQPQQTCNSGQICNNGACNTPATWHTVFSYSDTSGNNTTSFSLRGSQSRITYNCTVSDSARSISWFNGSIEAVDPNQPYPQNDNFASIVDCPANKTFNEYSLPPGQYYLHLDNLNSNYSITVENYY